MLALFTSFFFVSIGFTQTEFGSFKIRNKSEFRYYDVHTFLYETSVKESEKSPEEDAYVDERGGFYGIKGKTYNGRIMGTGYKLRPGQEKNFNTAGGQYAIICEYDPDYTNRTRQLKTLKIYRNTIIELTDERCTLIYEENGKIIKDEYGL